MAGEGSWALEQASVSHRGRVWEPSLPLLHGSEASDSLHGTSLRASAAPQSIHASHKISVPLSGALIHACSFLSALSVRFSLKNT